MTKQIVKNSTDIILYFHIKNSSDGTAKTGLVYNSAGAKAYYVRQGTTATSITLATQTVNGAHSDGGFVEVDATNMPGLYRFDPPDAVFATGIDISVIQLSFDGVFTNPMEIQLVDSSSAPSAATIADAVWDEAIADHTGGTTFGGKNQNLIPSETINDYKADVSNLDVAVSTRSSHVAADIWSVVTRALTDKSNFNLATDQSGVTFGIVNALGTQAKADVNAEVDTGLSDIDLDHLINSDFGASKPADGSLMDLIMNKDVSQTFDPTTDSLEAIADSSTTPPTVEEIADGVWDELSTGHIDAGKAGAQLWTDIDAIVAKLPTNNIADQTLLLDLIKQNRFYNVSLELVAAAVENVTRKVAVGKLSHIHYSIKNEGDSDWSSPVATGTLYAWYDALGEDDPHWMKESD